jgi:hypothetical protein
MMRRVVRELVLRTNDFRLLQRGYGAIYSAAVACFLRYVARKQALVRSVYIRRSQDAQNWIPGLSDIDLTVILDAPPSPEAEYRALEEFWAPYVRLKTWFPMFGEVEILAQHEFGAWLAKTSYRPGRHPWELIYGEREAALEADAAPSWRLRALGLAWWIYEDLLPPCVARPDSLVRGRDIQRRVDKIFRLLGPVLREAGRPESSGFHRDPAEMVASALEAIESAAIHLLPIRRARRREGPRSSLIQSRVDEGRMLVVEDGLDRATLAGLISKNRQAKQNVPLVLPRCLLEYRVRFYDPYDYAVLSRDWTAETGEHPLEDVPPPGEPEFLQNLLSRFRDLQVTSRGEELFTDGLKVDQVSNTLLMVAALRMLRDGRVIPCRDEISACSAVEFPEYARAVEQIGSLMGAGRLQEARREYFFLLRSMLNQPGVYLEAPDPVASAASVS